MVPLAVVITRVVLGQTLVPGPGEPGFDPALLAKAEAYNVELHELMTVPLGWGLEAFVSDPQNRKLIDDFFDAGATDFKAFTGKHPYQVLDTYEEFNDLGMFGGVQAAGDAFRYAVLRDSHAPAAQVDAARAALQRALTGLHWYTQVTGQPGVTARGLQRIAPEGTDPPLPGGVPMTVPVLPPMTPKDGQWHADQSGQLPFLIWHDDTSKDQLDGYVFALGAVYDVIHGDPAFSETDLVADARAIGLKLMQKVEVGPGETTDLVIIDADGQPTNFHDLAAEEFPLGAVNADALNGFNALMALSIIRTLFHITGDETLGHFYYDELVTKRRYPNCAKASVAKMYLGVFTDFSNVNMAFVAAYNLLRYENDPTLHGRYADILETELYHPGVNRQAGGLGQSLFDFIYAGFTPDAGVALSLSTLQEWPKPPWWDLAVDNTGLPSEPTDPTKATMPLPMRLRPPSNFEWRDDPYTLSGGGSTLLNPGGDFHAAYWLGRYLKANGSNVSPNARGLPVTMPPPPPMKQGCGCQSEPLSAGWLAVLLAVRSRRPVIPTARAASARSSRRAACAGDRASGRSG